MANAPSIEAACKMGAVGGPAIEAERLAFEAWVRGHCWTLGAWWNGVGYIGVGEGDGTSYVCPLAMQTRKMWAAWRDRAALAQENPNDCQCKGADGKPLMQCDECPR